LIKEVLVSHSENFFSVCLKTCGGEGGKSAKKVAIQYFCSILKHVCDDNTPLLFKLNNWMAFWHASVIAILHYPHQDFKNFHPLETNKQQEHNTRMQSWHY